jgi:hypothetical protein
MSAALPMLSSPLEFLFASCPADKRKAFGLCGGYGRRAPKLWRRLWDNKGSLGVSPQVIVSPEPLI